MSPCQNCAWRPARKCSLCDACYMQLRRTGQPRSAELVLRHLARIVDQELTIQTT